MATSTHAVPPRPPSTAYEITVSVTVTVEPGAPPTVTHTDPRPVSARALPSLPVGPNVSAHRPSYRLEVVAPNGAILYRRPYARPGYVEAYGSDSAWTRLPERHTQVLVTLIPAFPKGTGLSVVAYEPNSRSPWLSIPLR
jgi:hypothetical protein